MPQPIIKIAFVGNTLNTGGAEKVQAKLSFLFESNNIECHHILVNGDIGYKYAGILFNMGPLKNKSNGPFNKLLRMRVLMKYLRKENFDFIIDIRVKNNFIQEYFINKLIYNAAVIQYIHSFNTNMYFSSSKTLSWLLYNKCHSFITVSNEIREKVKTKYGFKNVFTIYNPIDVNEIKKLSNVKNNISEKYILGIGRMNRFIKQFDHLINSYKNSRAKNSNIKLLLVGNGEDKQYFQDLVKKLKLQDFVVFKAFSTNPFPYYKNALFTCLTSKFEGFPNVLIESLACGTPVVSYNCQSGPSEIITDRFNGLLVENQSTTKMSEAMDKMILDQNLYNVCKSNAINSVSKFTIDKIGKQWLNHLKINY